MASVLEMHQKPRGCVNFCTNLCTQLDCFMNNSRESLNRSWLMACKRHPLYCLRKPRPLSQNNRTSAWDGEKLLPFTKEVRFSRRRETQGHLTVRLTTQTSCLVLSAAVICINYSANKQTERKRRGGLQRLQTCVPNKRIMSVRDVLTCNNDILM